MDDAKWHKWNRGQEYWGWNLFACQALYPLKPHFFLEGLYIQEKMGQQKSFRVPGRTVQNFKWFRDCLWQRLHYCTPCYTWGHHIMETAAEHRLSGTTCSHHVTLPLWELHWLSILFHAQIKVLVLTCKALYVLGPWHRMDRLSLRMSARPLRFQGESFLQVPAMVGLTRAFFGLASWPWNC